MGPTLVFLLLALSPPAAAASGGELPAAQVPAPSQCAAAIVSISPCLAHVAVVAPPASPSPSPTAACCAAFLRAVYGGVGGEVCFCYLVRDPLLLGFPIDASRLGSLFPTCAALNATAIPAAAAAVAGSLAGTCRESKALPPMHSSPTDAPKLFPAVTSAMGPAPHALPDRSGASPPPPPPCEPEDIALVFIVSMFLLLLGRI